MRAVHKYQLPLLNSFTLAMPEGAEVVHVGVQNGKPVLFAMVDLNASTSDRLFWMFASGQSVPEQVGPLSVGRYLGTILTDSPVGNPNGFVGHLFEGTASPPSAAR